jgi:subtilisin family serine protease
MKAQKIALRGILCCASLSLLTVPVSAISAEKSDSPAALPTSNSTQNNFKLSDDKTAVAVANDMRVLLGRDYGRFRTVDTARAIPNQYIVVYKDSYVNKMTIARAGSTLSGLSAKQTADYQAQAVTDMTNDLASNHRITVTKTFGHALGGFAAKMSDKALAAMIKDPSIDFIEQDQVMTIAAIQNNATWGLDRVDEADLPLDGFYEFNFDGSGVDAYVIDTGIRASHNQFGGRVSSGFTAINDGRGTTDCNGHGTHVAGTVGSQTYGIAKNVNLIAVRVLGCNGSGSNAGVIDGVNYVAQNASGPSVANMSLGGGNSAALDQAVENAINQGVTFVVAAGNSNANACSGSPNRVPPALTVGSTTSSDVRSSFSNFGSCVDIFAPGSSITSTWSTSDSASNTISGTSMAAPHVAGVVALYMDQTPSATPAQVESAVESAAVSGRLSSLGTGSPNLLLQSLLGDGGGDGGGGGDACAYEDDFTSSTGWQNLSSSTCTTGTYVRTNPTQITNSGVVTQVGGDDEGDGFALFTATNTSAGANDVDGGECIAQSPSISVNDASTLSLAWFHGQRDTGDDASGDSFGIEYSLNGGSTFNSLVQIGDTRTQAQWQDASTAIPAGSNVLIRIRASDGSAAGDLIEGGLDSVKICPN